MEGKTIITSQTLYHIIEGNASPQEEALFRQWLGEDPSHERYFQQLQAQYNQEPRELSPEEIGTAWLHYKKQLPRTGISIKRWQKISAAAAVLLLFGLSLTLFFNPKHTLPSASLHPILPGQKKAILELPGGQIYKLGQQQHILQEEGGHRIIADSMTINYLLATSPTEKSELHKLYVPRGGEFRLELEDGTKVWVNSDTELHYPVPFPASSREIHLKGEAYFEVEPDSTRPFIVHSGEQEITVLGTSFGVTGYPSESTISTTLVEGSVRVNYKNDKQIWILNPGTHIAYDRTTQEISQTKGDIEQYISWVEGKYIFNIQRLEDMLTTLARWYDFEVTYIQPEVKEILFTGELRRFDDFRHILKIIERSGDARFNIEGSHITVYKNSTEG